MALPYNADYHKQTRAMELARVARGVAFDAKQARQQRDPSYKGVPPNSTGSWATPFTTNHDESWKPLIPLRKQDMALWNQERAYRRMVSEGKISGGFFRSPATQSYFNERLKQKGAQASKLYNPLAPGRRIRKALQPTDFGKYELAQKLERLDNQLDTQDNVSLTFDKSTNDLIDSIRSLLFVLAPSFTVSEAQNTFETLGAILQKAEALLSTQLGKDTEHLYEVGEEYAPEKLAVNTRRLAVFVSSIRKLYQFMERVYGGASTENEGARSKMAVGAAQDLFSRTELGGINKEAGEAVKRWSSAAMEDERREGEEQSAAEAQAAQLSQQEAMATGADVPAFDARAVSGAVSGLLEDAGQPVGEEGVAAPLDATSAYLPFSKRELAMMSDDTIRRVVRAMMTQGRNSQIRKILIEENELDWSVKPSSLNIRVPILGSPQSAAEADVLEEAVEKIASDVVSYSKAPEAAAAAAAAAAPAVTFSSSAAAAASAPPLPKPGDTKEALEDWVKYSYYITGLTQTRIVAELEKQGIQTSQASISRIVSRERKDAFRARTGY